MSTLPREPATRLNPEETAGPIGLLEGTELVGEFKSSGYREASRLVARSDGRLVRLSPVLYAVVTALEKRAAVAPAGRAETLSQVAERVSNETGLELTADHIAYLMDGKLAPLGITTDSNGRLPIIAKSVPFLSLRFKKALLPSSATWFLGGLFSWLFNPVLVVAGVTAALVGEIWLFATQPMGSALAQALADPTSVLLIGLLAVVSAFFHEIGHATGCRYSGVRPGPIGAGVYLVWPVFYTDITNSYRLGRAGRLRTVLGGVYFNALFIIGLMLLYVWTGSPFLLAAIIVSNLELVQQLLPTLRFDGYYIVSDLVGIPDLFKYIGPILKRYILRKPADERLQALKTWPQRVVTVWVLVVIPALIAQLSFLVFQLPQFIDLAGQRISDIGLNTTASGPDILGLVGDIALTMFSLLPLAGLLVLVLLAVRGVANILRKLLSDGGQPAEPAPSALTRSNHTTPARGWHPRSPVANYLLVFNTVLLVTTSAYILSGPGSRPTPPASSSPSDRTSDGLSGGSDSLLPLLPRNDKSTSALPAGDDETVQSVIDGDSFELTSGEKIRLIGIDAPDTETGDCFSAEAKAELTELLSPARTVRLVYDVNRSDQFGRTLAYVYRLSDGLFVNLALARDGFAYPARDPSNTAHADELDAAVTEARDAGRGLWSSCSGGPTTGRNPTMSDRPRQGSSRNTTPPRTPPRATPTSVTPPVPQAPDSDKDSNLLDNVLDWLIGAT
ncbi:MAG TPA: thermonuclease family protein [Acidimicrobiales bacterium]|nr:thermonuclease family protein [Acidimicrobiales bacterium]